MNFNELKLELRERGFDLPDHRLGFYINRAYNELVETDLWSFRRTSVSGTAGVSSVTNITDLGPIETVNVIEGTVVTPLIFTPWSALPQWEGTVRTSAGTARYFYVPSGGTSVLAWGSDVGAGAMEVNYYKVATDLAAVTDTPIVPTRFQLLIADIAARMAYRDAEKFDAAEAMHRQLERDLLQMRFALGVESQSPAGRIETTELW